MDYIASENRYQSMQYRRCLIPASYYYEWEHQGTEKIRYAIQPYERKMMYMAALYRMDEKQPVFAVLTREAEPEIRFIHHRMPVLLSEKSCRDWLDPNHSPEDVLCEALRSTVYRKA